MSILFKSSVINGLELKNRFIRSATWEGMASADGNCTPELTEKMHELATGGVGLIITGHSYILPEGQAGPGQLGIHDDAMIPDLKKMTSAVHQAGGKILMQLAHAGIFAATDLTGVAPWAPSAKPPHSQLVAKKMTMDDIDLVIKAFGKAAKRAKESGFDGVQLHAAHGYLLSEFLSPAFNLRKDEYGGSLKNRAKIVLSTLSEVRNNIGNSYPLFIKLNSQDFLKNGLKLEDSLEIAKLLAENSVDAIELSGGTNDSGRLMPVRPGKLSISKEAFYREAAKKFKEAIDIPLMLVGGIRSFEVANILAEENITDYISMSRPFIREPGLVNRWMEGDLTPSSCISDNQCFEPIMMGEGIYCVTAKKQKRA